MPRLFKTVQEGQVQTRGLFKGVKHSISVPNSPLSECIFHSNPFKFIMLLNIIIVAEGSFKRDTVCKM